MNDHTGVIVDKYLYWPHKLVGQGSFATVYRGKRLSDGLAMAVKKIKINEMSNRMNKLWSEIKIMKQLSHPNILKLYDVNLDLESEVVYLFLEWCEEGDLSQLIKLLKRPNPTSVGLKPTNDSGKLKEKDIRGYFEQIRRGLEYLHQEHILHRDLKPQNILLHQGTIKICDFGLSILADQNSLITTMCGSPMYMAPEVIKHEEYTIKADLWSLGVILYEMFYGRHPYPVDNYHELTQIVEKPINYPLERVISESGTDLLRSLLVVEHQARLSWVNFFEHPWFQSDLDNILRRRTGGEFQLDDSDVFSLSIELPKSNKQKKFDTGNLSKIRLTKSNDDTDEFYSYDSDSDEENHSLSYGTSSTSQELKFLGHGTSSTSQELKFLGPDAPEQSLSKENSQVVLPSRPVAIKESKKTKGFSMSQYIVNDYQTPPKSPPVDQFGQSAPVLKSPFGQSYSPRLNFSSMGSQVYKCVSKSYGVLKKNL